LESEELEAMSPDVGGRSNPADHALLASHRFGVQKAQAGDVRAVDGDVAMAKELVPAADAQHHAPSPHRVGQFGPPRHEVRTDDSLHPVGPTTDHDHAGPGREAVASAHRRDRDTESPPLRASLESAD